MNCKKCESLMTKKHIMNSGNSKYQIYECPKCGEESMNCMGLA